MNLPIILVGGGGHAKVLLEALSLSGQKVLGIVDIDSTRWGASVRGATILGNEDYLRSFQAGDVALVNGVGCVDAESLQKRKALYDRLKARGYGFRPVVHPAAVLASGFVLDEGVQIMAGVVVQPDASIGANTIVNTGAIVEHDCRVGRNIHLAPRAVLGGGVVVDDEAFVGAGAVVVQGIRIGPRCMVASGALVRRDVSPGVAVAGVPAVELRA